MKGIDTENDNLSVSRIKLFVHFMFVSYYLVIAVLEQSLCDIDCRNMDGQLYIANKVHINA